MEKSLADLISEVEELMENAKNKREEDEKEKNEFDTEKKPEKIDSASVNNEKKNTALNFTVGFDKNGESTIIDLKSAPHMFICGEQKSKMIRSVLTELINLYDDSVKLIISGDYCFYSQFGALPNLVHTIAKNDRETEALLRYAVWEMENRFDLICNELCRNLDEYNRKTGKNVPYIIISIDDFDKLCSINKQIYNDIIRLTQKSRAAGIYVIIGCKSALTSMKYALSNIPTQIVFKVDTVKESKSLFGKSCAEKLNNEELLFSQYSVNPTLLHIPTFQNEILNPLTSYQESFRDDASKFVNEYMSKIKQVKKSDIESVLEAIKSYDSFFTSTIQRKLSWGYARTCKSLNQLERDNIIARKTVRSPYFKIGEVK